VSGLLNKRAEGQRIFFNRWGIEKKRRKGMSSNLKHAPSGDGAPQQVQAGFRPMAFMVVAYLFVVTYFQLAIGGPDSMNILMPALVEKFHMEPGQIMGAIGSVRLLGIIAGIVAGTLIMKYGFKAIGVPSIIACGIAVGMMGRVDTWTGIMVIQVVLTILTPVLMALQGGLIANWFVRKKGVVFGIVTIAAPLSGATYTPIGMKIFQNVGFSAFFTWLGAMIFVVGLVGFVAMKDKPEDHGFDPDGIPFTPEEKAELEASKIKAGETKWPLKRLLLNKEYWYISIAWGLIGGLMMAGIMSQVIPILTNSGFELNRALMSLSIASIAGMPLSYVWGWIDDKVGTPKTNAVFTLVYLFGALGFAYGSGDRPTLLYIGMFCVSLGMAGMPNLMPSLVAYVYGRDEFVSVGRWINLPMAFFMSVGMYYLAKVHDMTGSYAFAFKSFVPVSIFCMILFLLIRRTMDPERLALQGHEDGIN
jgi:sugar phosphate permease